MVVTAGPMYRIIAYAECNNCGGELHQGRYLYDGSLTDWSHNLNGKDCPPITTADPIYIRSVHDDDTR